MRPKTKVFLDTNILVYVYDRHDIHRSEEAVRLLENELSEATVMISTQVVNEFCNVMTTKKGSLMKRDDLHRALGGVLSPMLTHFPSLEFYRRALKLLDSYSLSFYDALIVQAALDLECDVIYSEDLQDGQQFGSLRVVNPFKS